MQVAISILPLVIAAPAVAGDFEFQDVTGTSGLAIPLAGTAGGVAVGDFDGDGWTDVCFVGADDYRPQLFRNNGSAIMGGASRPLFSDVTLRALPADREPASALMLADLDGDGDLDIVAVRRFPTLLHPEGDNRDTGLMFYANQGGRFVKTQTDPQLARESTRHGGLALSDLDGDGDLDVVYAHNAGSGFIALNDGPNGWTDATASLFPELSNNNRYFSLLLADFSGDGRTDLHAAVDFFPDFHGWGQPGGGFLDVSFAVGATNTGADMGLAIGDIENDGDLDIYSTNINYGVLYVNDGQGALSNGAPTSGVSGWGFGTTVGWGSAFCDFDHDGDQDLVFVGYGLPGKLYENDGTGDFSIVPASAHGLGLVGHGLIPFDFDLDGDQDLLVLSKGNETPRLYENVSDFADRHWAAFELRGTASNPHGVGARLEIWNHGAYQTRTVMAGYSFKSGPPMDAHFGLGTAKRVEKLRIEWPSGQVQRLFDLPADTRHVIVEP